MTVVRALLQDGTTICATIHSPSQYCFSLFDSLIMLVRGRVVYFGPTTGAAAFATHACPKVKEMTAGYNEAEFLVVRLCSSWYTQLDSKHMVISSFSFSDSDFSLYQCQCRTLSQKLIARIGAGKLPMLTKSPTCAG